MSSWDPTGQQPYGEQPPPPGEQPPPGQQPYGQMPPPPPYGQMPPPPYGQAPFNPYPAQQGTNGFAIGIAYFAARNN